MAKTLHQKWNEIPAWFCRKKKIFAEFSDYILDRNNANHHRIFIDRDSKILAVAHLDTVQKAQYFKKRRGKIFATGCDDRLGCWMAYTLSKELGMDLLLCDHEEKALSTAVYHICKDYNWIVEFDRGGNDVVTYDLDCDEFLKEIKEFWNVGFGAFSDISNLETTACCMNVGIGYHYNHTQYEYVNIGEMRQAIFKFKTFHSKHKNTKFVQDYKPNIRTYRGYIYDDIPDPQDFDNQETDFCDICGQIGQRIYDITLCRECLETAIYNSPLLYD